MEVIINHIFTLPIITAFIATAAATPLCLIFIKKLKIFDDPATHKHPAIIHKKPIPRAGGLPLFLGIIIASIFFIPLTQTTVSIFIASFIALAVGLIDDKYDISPYFRFAMNFVCAIIVVLIGHVSIPFITNPLGGILHLNTIGIDLSIVGLSLLISLGDIIAIFLIVWVMNMLNWSKGVDGQMPGVVAIAAIVIGILSLRFPVIDEGGATSVTLAFIIAGAALGFLIYNFHPAKIFPGYGATAIYLLLAVVSMLSSAKIATAILVMGVPLADGLFTIARRVLTGHSPFLHDKKHFHHLLLDAGFGQRRIALFYWTVSAILGALSLILNSRGKLFAIIMVVIIVGAVLLFLNRMIKKQNDKTFI